MNASFYVFDYDTDVEDYVRNSKLEYCKYYCPTMLEILERFNRKRNLLTMEQIRKRIEEGYVIVPLSRSFYIVDLLKYYNLELKPCFMTSKAFKIFRKVYKDYI